MLTEVGDLVGGSVPFVGLFVGDSVGFCAVYIIFTPYHRNISENRLRRKKDLFQRATLTGRLGRAALQSWDDGRLVAAAAVSAAGLDGGFLVGHHRVGRAVEVVAHQ